MELIDLRNGLSIADLLTLVGAAIVVTILVELIKRTFAWSAQFTDRFAPLASCISGVVLSVLAAIYLSGDIAQAALTGFLAGALAAGLYDIAAARVASIFAKLPTGSGGTP